MIVFYGSLIFISFIVAFLLSRILIKLQGFGLHVEHEKTNLSVLRKQRVELDHDFQNGIITQQEHELAISDLAYRYLDEKKDSKPLKSSVASHKYIAVSLFILCPTLALGLYLIFGNIDGLRVEKSPADSISSITHQEFVEMTANLSKHLENNSGDVKGWIMLGRAYAILNDYKNASESWRKALGLAPDNLELRVSLAEALVLLKQGDFSEEANQLIRQVLEIDPSHQKGLALAGGIEYSRNNYEGAAEIWQKLLNLVKDDLEYSRSIEKSIRDAENKAKKTPFNLLLRGTVRLADDLLDKLPSTYSVFIVVRQNSGSLMPLIVDKIKVRDLPYSFELDNTNIMQGGIRLESAGNLYQITSFVSKTGSVDDKVRTVIGNTVKIKLQQAGIELILSEK
ncbi:MAG: c-type cytochrome biogenesis protein CcmI [Proteobacteria bacterium]|nr:c-type cytochrome biogenesis protein CcmI [Pseudomonadota bacterium]